MTYNQGYCYAYRRAWYHPAFKDLREASIWNYLYQNAAYELTEVNINGYTFQLERGQIAVSISYLAKGFCMSEKGVRVVIQKLEKLGMVGKRGTSRGTILTICNYEDYQRKEKTKGEPKGNKGASRGRAKGDNINEDNKNNEENEDKFDQFWEIYPRKHGKKAAKKLFESLSKKGIDYEKIIRGVTAYKQHCQANNILPEYIKHPTTWLNGECWEDEYKEKKQKIEPILHDIEEERKRQEAWANGKPY